MKIICISDTHTKHNQIPSQYIDNADGSIDMIIHAGDVSSRGYKTEITNFLNWYNDLNFRHKILIAGNHDFYFEEAKPEELNEMLAEYPNITYLNDSGVEIEGFKIWGSPVQPWFYNWAFNRTSPMINEHWEKIPIDTNILIVHGGPKHIGSLNITTRDRSDVGCPYLYQKLSELKQLKLFVQGHIHEGRGAYTSSDKQLFVNASLLNLQYELVNKPFVIDTEKWQIISS